MKYLALALVVVVSSCSNTIYIVRHAEKAPVQAGASQMMATDPPLSDAGKARAEQLKEQLRNMNVKHIYSTNFKRTTNTAKPLADQLSLPVNIYSSRRDSTDAFIQQLKGIKKGNVLVVGHSNTIDDLANKLAGSTVVAADLPETDYDNLFILKRKGNKYRFSRSTYGVTTD